MALAVSFDFSVEKTRRFDSQLWQVLCRLGNQFDQAEERLDMKLLDPFLNLFVVLGEVDQSAQAIPNLNGVEFDLIGRSPFVRRDQKPQVQTEGLQIVAEIPQSHIVIFAGFEF